MKTQNETLKAFIQGLENKNEKIQNKVIEEYHNRQLHKAMSDLGVLCFTIDINDNKTLKGGLKE
jgi:hypothetical protein